MGQIVSCVAMSVTWCFCSAVGSLLGACLGNDKASNVPPGANSGRRRSVLLLLLSILIAFAFKYGIAPALVESDEEWTLSASEIAKDQATNFIRDNWVDGCEDYEEEALREKCIANSGVYRSSACATLFFVLAAVVVMLKPSFNREVWPAKYVLFLFMTAATIFVPNEPTFTDIYMNIARVGGVCHIFLQQLILLDVAYNWNDSWVSKSNAAEAEEAGSGQKWLGAILASCGVLFTCSYVVIILMFIYFSGCPTNNAFISTTLLWTFIIPAAQLSGDEGSLLSSAVTVAWSTYLCFIAVSKNPDANCNPRLGDDDISGILFGLLVTLMSLTWTAYSWTAGKTLHEDESISEGANDSNAGKVSTEEDNSKTEETRKVTGVVTGAHEDNENTSREGGTANASKEDDQSSRGFSNSWKLCMILAVISCWFAMIMTSWGAVSSGGAAANPTVGEVSMWMIMSSQWVFLSLYLWTLMAPRLFPNRDFS